MQVFATLLAVILDVFGVRLFSCEADTGTVLPRVADLTLHEEPSQVIRNLNGKDAFVVNCVFNTMLRVFIKGRRPWVLVMTADAADRLVVLVDLIGDGRHFDGLLLRLFVAVVVVFTARATAAKDGVFGGGG